MAFDGESLDNGVFETQTLNVGQADARVSITEDGEIILVDVNTEKVAEELDEVFAARTTPKTADGKIPIDHLVVTHLHNDHVKGVESLLDRYEIQHVIEPDDKRYDVCDSKTGEPDGGVGENIKKLIPMRYLNTGLKIFHRFRTDRRCSHTRTQTPRSWDHRTPTALLT